jgi:hypothetical protein
VRHDPAETREERAEGEWIIAAPETVINPVLTGKRFYNVAAKKVWAISCSRAELFSHP